MRDGERNTARMVPDTHLRDSTSLARSEQPTIRRPPHRAKQQVTTGTSEAADTTGTNDASDTAAYRPTGEATAAWPLGCRSVCRRHDHE
jgi:hypothetical protein